ncbi:hypothetical protein ABEB36_014979 [Hypothenemus hampei]|uniref:Cytochrome P450 306a1 n=1 Tax=Hypothenemus hampei TaxID=57062 RepID=A0ABD1E1F4_HYPHA
MFVYLLVTLLCLLLLHNYWKLRNLPPGPWGLPVIGYLPWLDPDAPHLTLATLAKKYGPIYSLSLGSVSTIIISDSKIIKKIFSKDVTTCRAPLYVTHGIMHGKGLICAEVELWKDQRRFVHDWLRNIGASKIGPQKKNMEILILKHTTQLIERLRIEGKDGPIDSHEALRHQIGSLMCELVFAESWSKDDKTWNDLLEQQEAGLKLIGVAGPLNFLPFLRILPMFKRIMSYLLEGQKKAHQIYQNFIDKYEVALSNQACLENNYSLVKAFLEQRNRLSNKEPSAQFYTHEQLRFLMADIFGAGLDTTLATSRWIFLYLALHEDIQTKVRNEIQMIINDRVPTMDDLNSMHFTAACIAEIQRIRPVVPLGMPHGCFDAFEIDGYIVPKGSMIVPLLWSINMNEEQYKNPHQFNPNNFLDLDGQFCKNENFIPFQAGKRMCVGDELGRMLLFLILVSVLRNFQLKLTNKDEASTCGDIGIIMSPKPHKIWFKQIHE